MRLGFFFQKKMFLLSSARSPGKSLSKEIPFTMSTINASSAYCSVLIIFVSFVRSFSFAFTFIVFRLFIYLFLYFRLQFDFITLTLVLLLLLHSHRLWTILLLRVCISSTHKHTHTHTRIILSDFVHPFLLIFVCDFYILF